MQTGLATTAFLMGLAGGPHCLGMCGIACGGLVRANAGAPRLAMFQYQAGRLLGYSMAGGFAAFAAQNLASLSRYTAALHPLWTLFHVMVLVWGLALLLWARQPDWAQTLGHRLWAVVRPAGQGSKRVFVLGLLWAFMPCGLLYSALLVASMNNHWTGGMLSMALFALGSSISLSFAPWFWNQVQKWSSPQRQNWSMRIAGASLCVIAGWALLHDMAPTFADACMALLPF